MNNFQETLGQIYASLNGPKNFNDWRDNSFQQKSCLALAETDLYHKFYRKNEKWNLWYFKVVRDSISYIFNFRSFQSFNPVIVML